MALDVQIKRIYDPAAEEGGYRVLVDHIWPRGVSRERGRLDEWARELAPSDELRRWFEPSVPAVPAPLCVECAVRGDRDRVPDRDDRRAAAARSLESGLRGLALANRSDPLPTQKEVDGEQLGSDVARFETEAA